MLRLLILILAVFQIGTLTAQTVSLPTIPIGTDAYLQWDRIFYQRIGMRAYMRSTYDREGNNRAADASHFLYQESDSFNVSLDVKNPGVLYFVRTNHFHGSPWHYEVDGKDFLVQETATADPIDAKKKFTHTEFIPQHLFPYPLTWTWAITKGADLMWVPIPFEKSMRLAYSRTLYGTGYYIYHSFGKGIQHLSRPLTGWSQTAPDPKVIHLLKSAGSDQAQKGDSVKTVRKTLSLKPNQTVELANFSGTAQIIRALEFKIPLAQALDFGKNRLKITWDRRWAASVDVPLDLFFGVGHLHNPQKKEYLVKGFPISVRYDAQSVYLACYWPMPFFQHAQLELQERQGKSFSNIQCTIKTVPFKGERRFATYFHATYADIPTPVLGQDMTFLDTDQVEGGGPWSGNFVGMSWIFSRNGRLNTLEGDPRFFFDDSKTPQAWGTGSEEWGGGGDYWGGENMSIPFAGHPVGTTEKTAKSPLDLVNSAYRFLIADYFPFGKRAVIRLEHGAQNSEDEHYSGVVYWYGAPKPVLQLTDEFNVCNTADVQAHQYQSPTAEAPYQLVSRYELGPDTDIRSYFIPKARSYNTSRLYFPAESDSVRIMKGTSRFVVTLESTNLGVLLRRKFDYQYPNQQARVWVKDEQRNTDWQDAGVWYTAGSNTCYFSYPPGGPFSKGELAPSNPVVITSNRRWREEEFLIDRSLTEGISKLEIRIEWMPDEKPLFVGKPFPQPSAWSEARYWVYCYQAP